MQGLQKTVHADTEFWSLPPNYPNAIMAYKLPAGVKIRPDAQGTERDGYAHVYDPANKEGWIAVGDLTPFEDSVRTPIPTPAPAPKPSTPPPASNSSMIGSGIDWKTVGYAAGAVGGALLLFGGAAYYLKKRRRR